MAEHIPLDPFEPHTEEHTDEHEHETSFGGHDNTGFDPDDYDTDEQRKNANLIIDVLRKNGLPAPSDVFYAVGEGDVPIVSEDKVNWYAIKFGKSGDGEEIIGIIPIGYASDPPDTLKIKFGLQVDQGDDETTPLIGGSSLGDIRIQAQRQLIDEVQRNFPEMNVTKLRFSTDDSGKITVSVESSRGGFTDRLGIKRTQYKRLYKEDGVSLNKDLPKSVKDALGRPAQQVLFENQERINENSERIKQLEESLEQAEKDKRIQSSRIQQLEKKLIEEREEYERENRRISKKLEEANKRLKNSINEKEKKELNKEIQRLESQLKSKDEMIRQVEESNKTLTRLLEDRAEREAKLDEEEGSRARILEEKTNIEREMRSKTAQLEQENERLGLTTSESERQAIISTIRLLKPAIEEIEQKAGEYATKLEKSNESIELQRKQILQMDQQYNIEKKISERWNRQLAEANEKLQKSTSPAVRQKLEGDIKELRSLLAESNERLRNQGLTHDEREEIERLREETEEIEETNEAIFSRLSLKEKVKWIFRKYGVTIVGVFAPIGTVISGIITELNIKAGLRKVATGVSNGLKTIGSKLAQILPGIAGALVSFLFRTAGGAVGFLAKNTWLLILLAVTFVIEQFKSKKKS